MQDEPRLPTASVTAASSARQVAALAGATFRQSVRMKAFAAPLVFAATALLASPFLPSDGTPVGAVRLAITVNLVAASIFGAVSAVMLSSVIFAREKRDRTNVLVATKPMPRWSLFAGRALGVSAVMAAVFFGMTVLTWVLVTYVSVRESGRSDEAAAQIAEMLTVRSSTGPAWETGPVRAPQSGAAGDYVLAPGKKVRWRFSVPPNRSGAGHYLGRIYVGTPGVAYHLSARNPETGEVAWLDVEPDPREHGASMFRIPAHLVARSPGGGRGLRVVDVQLTNDGDGPLAFSQNPPIVLQAGGYIYVSSEGTYSWMFTLPEGGHVAPSFRLRISRGYSMSRGVDLTFVRGEGAGRIEETHRVAAGHRRITIVPVSDALVAGGGRVDVTLRGVDGASIRVPATDSLTYAPRAGSFAGALVRWSLLELAKIVFLVLVTCAGATFLTFPIPALLGGAFVVGGYLVTFVVTLAVSGADVVPWPIAASLALLQGLLPDFVGSSAVSMIYDGVVIPAGFVAWTFMTLVVLRGGVAAAVGALMSHRSEYGA